MQWNQEFPNKAIALFENLAICYKVQHTFVQLFWLSKREDTGLSRNAYYNVRSFVCLKIYFFIWKAELQGKVESKCVHFKSIDLFHTNNHYSQG